MALPKRHVAGDTFVVGSGPFRYCRRALWIWSDRVPPCPVFPAMSRFIVFTATSAAWGWYAEEMRWWTPQVFRNVLVAWEENSGPPSDVRVSGIPNVEKVSLSDCRRPDVPRHDWPVRKPVHQHKVGVSFVVEEVSTQVLLWLHGCGRWHCWLGRGIAVANGAPVTGVGYVSCDAGPKQ